MAAAAAEEDEAVGGGTSPGIRWLPTVGDTGARLSPAAECDNVEVEATGWMGVDERGCKW